MYIWLQRHGYPNLGQQQGSHDGQEVARWQVASPTATDMMFSFEHHGRMIAWPVNLDHEAALVYQRHQHITQAVMVASRQAILGWGATVKSKAEKQQKMSCW